MADSERRCDICGAPATHAVSDVKVTRPGDSSWVHFEPLGNVRVRCDLHPTESGEYDELDLPLLWSGR